MNIKEFSKYAGLSALIVVGAFELSRSAIIRGNRRYNNGQSSEPIRRTTGEGSSCIVTVRQTLVGKKSGGRVITERIVNYPHAPLSNYSRRTSQSLGPGREITLTDGTRARGE